ncbi:MAG: hypothetical protein AB7J46_07915 [Candidatus Altimarinota bacterium]
MHLCSFTLNEIQLCEIKAALSKLEAGHRARVAWFGDHSLEGNVLSIHALDLLTVLSHCHRSPDNEIELFRIRREAMAQLSDLIKNSRNDIKKQNYEIWLKSYKKLWPGTDSNVDLTQAPPQPNRIELVPGVSRLGQSCSSPIP